MLTGWASRRRRNSHSAAVWALAAVPDFGVLMPRSFPFRAPGTIFGRTTLRMVVMMVMAMMMVTHVIAKILTVIEVIGWYVDLYIEPQGDYGDEIDE